MSVKILYRAILVVLCAGLLPGCNKQEQPQPAPSTIQYDTVQEEKIVLTNNLPGRVAAVVMAEVRPQVDGIILERLFEEGSYVTKGQVLYQIDPAIYEADYNTAKANLAEAEANLNAQAMREKRYRELVKVKAISQQDLDNATAAHGQARARIAKARAQLEATTINLAYTRIKAPVSGRIGASSVTVGALVTANQSKPLATIRQTDRVYVDIVQSSAETIRLRRALAQGVLSQGATLPNEQSQEETLRGKNLQTGEQLRGRNSGAVPAGGNGALVSLTLEDGSPYTRLNASTISEQLSLDREDTGQSPNMPTRDAEEKILGQLLFSEVSVGETTGSVALRAIIDNPDGLLLPGMYVTATIEEGTLENAILIPQKSVLADTTGQHFVYVLHEGQGVLPSGDGELPTQGKNDGDKADDSNGNTNRLAATPTKTASTSGQAFALSAGAYEESAPPLFEAEQRAIVLDRPLGNRWLVRAGLSAGEQVVVEGLQKVMPGELLCGIPVSESAGQQLSAQHFSEQDSFGHQSTDHQFTGQQSSGQQSSVTAKAPVPRGAPGNDKVAENGEVPEKDKVPGNGEVPKNGNMAENTQAAEKAQAVKHAEAAEKAQTGKVSPSDRLAKPSGNTGISAMEASPETCGGHGILEIAENYASHGGLTESQCLVEACETKPARAKRDTANAHKSERAGRASIPAVKPEETTTTTHEAAPKIITETVAEILARGDR